MIKYAKLDITSTGDNVIVNGSDFPNNKLIILSYTVLCDSDCLLTWKSSTTAISGPMSILAGGGMTVTSNFLAPAQPLGILKTVNEGDSIVLNVDAGNVGGMITYYVASN